MNKSPSRLRRNGKSIEIEWDDGVVHTYEPAELRSKCPCAVCKEKRRDPGSQPVQRGFLPILSKEDCVPLEITKMEPVGNYAYNIHFSDGHHTGIYPIEWLYSLGE